VALKLTAEYLDQLGLRRRRCRRCRLHPDPNLYPTLRPPPPPYYRCRRRYYRRRCRPHRN
jgi:hypothetical protein